MKNAAPLVGRILIALIFVISGFGKIAGFAQTRGYMESAGMPAAGFLLVMAIIFELGGSLFVAFGFKARIGAAMLIIFLVPATLIFHNQLGDQTQMIQFLKNLSIIGGLVLIIVYGAGPLSLDNRNRP